MLVVGVLVAATVFAGLMAGLFAAFGYAVMPGLREVGDHAFVAVMQRINVAIVNWLFLVLYLGGLVLSALSVGLLWFGPGGAGLSWAIAGFLLYVVMFVVTVVVNVPLNDELAAAGDVEQIVDPAALRRRFEGPWVRWNLVRAFASTAAFGCLVLSLAALG
ncbi:anthrone oxygenase family protein [Saccharopolyspora sp. 5N708]|uniref:anthrone oxygenase family protein n=1 Tax=Saccharopolyspora sp. 5N708 TaxID=3457424 RepID=UPI003FD35E98